MITVPPRMGDDVPADAPRSPTLPSLFINLHHQGDAIPLPPILRLPLSQMALPLPHPRRRSPRRIGSDGHDGLWLLRRHDVRREGRSEPHTVWKAEVAFELLPQPPSRTDRPHSIKDDSYRLFTPFPTSHSCIIHFHFPSCPLGILRP